jgi:hypothetical protein
MESGSDWGPVQQTGGSRPPCGQQSIVSWGLEGEQQLCEFSGCDGYPAGEYHRHLTRHFKELLAQDLAKEKDQLGQYSFVPLSCPRCVFKGSSELELLEHYGSYHQVLDYYVQVSRDRLCSGGARLELEQGGQCGTCGFSSPSTDHDRAPAGSWATCGASWPSVLWSSPSSAPPAGMRRAPEMVLGRV